jgi:ACS family tartrate transporter-like MFS transporter
MVSWGLVTVLTAFIHTSRQFYVARLLLGAAEASFFPGIIVYLTHWFTVKDRARAIAVFYAAIPVSNFIGSALAGWLLGIHWRGIAGWRWLFILEGLPAILFGVITLFYLTDRPAQAKWLTEAERVLINEKLLAERSAKSRGGRFSIWQASKDRRVYVLVAGYFFYQMAVVSNAFWMPTFLQRLSHLPATAVARLVMVPAITGLAGLFANSSLSDKSGEHKWHTVVPLLCAGCCYFFILPAAGHFSMVVMLFAVFNFFSLAAVPSFWSIPTLLFSETTAAVLFGLITSIGQLGGFVGPSMIAYFNDKTHSIHGSLGFISSALLISCFILSLLPSSAKRDN